MVQAQEQVLKVYDLIHTICDPEKPNTLEELEVDSLEIYISEEAHSIEEDINKQINDKDSNGESQFAEAVDQCVLDPD
ncbi:UPF0195 protein FAM96A [Crotalus adamanteus]|uniref:UPF0195 protein FAM96A n=1 Tax=Crotalus adamanteus TaxID=8729 RepID=A0AAW1BAB9_CROAD